MATYTAVVVVPDYIADTYGQDVVVVRLTAENARQALQVAAVQASRGAGLNDDGQPSDPDDWHVSALFVGHHVELTVT